MSGRAVHDSVDPIGTHANLWNNVAVGNNANSPAVRIWSGAFVSVFGNSGGATTLTLQYSADGVNFYASGDTIVLAGSGNFGKTFTIGAGWLRVNNLTAQTITATLQAS